MKRTGFTLIEILVVITIISLLATVGAGSYTTLTKHSFDSRRKADLEQIRSALEMWKSNNGVYPSTVPLGLTLTDGTNTYLQKVPNDPKAPTRVYNIVVTSSNYTLGADIENEAAASSDQCGDCGERYCNYCVTPYGAK